MRAAVAWSSAIHEVPFRDHEVAVPRVHDRPPLQAGSDLLRRVDDAGPLRLYPVTGIANWIEVLADWCNCHFHSMPSKLEYGSHFD